MRKGRNRLFGGEWGGEVCTKTFISHAIYQPFALNNQPELGLMKSKTNLKICYANIDLL